MLITKDITPIRWKGGTSFTKKYFQKIIAEKLRINVKGTLAAVQFTPKALLNPLQEGVWSAFVKA